MIAGLIAWQKLVHTGLLLTVIGGLGIGVALYFGMCVVLKADELKLLKSLVRK